MPSIAVISSPKDADFFPSGVKLVSAKDYLSGYTDRCGVRVWNFSGSYGFRSNGYYVSLLAAARGHTVFPSIQTIQQTKSPAFVHRISQELADEIHAAPFPSGVKRFSLDIYFGSTAEQPFAPLGREIFRLFPAPFLRAEFRRRKSAVELHSLRTLSPHDIPDAQREYASDCARRSMTRDPVRRIRKLRSFDLAILFDEKEELPPSDTDAIAKFVDAAKRTGFNVEIIGKDDFEKVPSFDALFIRETTNVNHHTFRFSQRAEASGLVVIDDPLSILRCTNKVYLAERLSCHGIPAPRTVIIGRDNRDDAIRSLGYPLILKQPDGAFSQGVMKAHNREEFYRKSDLFFENSDLIIAQEFVPTSYDWRIGVLGGRVLYACRYYMAEKHWQIVNWKGEGGVRVGKWDCVPLPKVPPVVLRTALRASKVIGDGLYGVDLKLIGERCVVIEVNDNPSLETGVEDLLLGDELYASIMRTFYDRVRAKKEGVRPVTARVQAKR